MVSDRVAASSFRARLVRLVLLLAALFGPVVAGLAPAATLPPTGAIEAVRLAADVLLFPGIPEAPSPANLGRVANVGVILAPGGAILIGSGASDAHGEEILARIERELPKPPALAVNLYAGAEHVLGNTALQRRGVTILAHEETDRTMRQNCARCIRNLAAAAGEDALRGSAPAPPGRLIGGSQTVESGGRRIEILHFGPAHQAGDLAVFDPASSVLFAGALASFGAVPDAHDADIEGWLAALEALGRIPARIVVPDRGPPAPPARLAEVATYLRELREATARAYRAGVPLRDAPRAAELPRYRQWALYEQNHARNVHHEYLRLEQRDLAR
jgi:glyoxylase-like metal-dependent hydrolase (beta-lactamase superfamily II)